jgi:hypothetical protein
MEALKPKMEMVTRRAEIRRRRRKRRRRRLYGFILMGSPSTLQMLTVPGLLSTPALKLSLSFHSSLSASLLR